MRPRQQPKQDTAESTPPCAARPSPGGHASPVPPSPTHDQPPAPPRTQPNDLPRLSVPDRQLLLSPRIIDDLLEDDHPARAVWNYVLQLDLTPLYDRIRARGSVAGRPAIDPRLLVAVWLYATLSGFTSARELAVLCIHYDPFIWLVGGVSVNYHTLADFRSENNPWRCCVNRA
jgi:transposase